MFDNRSCPWPGSAGIYDGNAWNALLDMKLWCILGSALISRRKKSIKKRRAKDFSRWGPECKMHQDVLILCVLCLRSSPFPDLSPPHLVINNIAGIVL